MAAHSYHLKEYTMVAGSCADSNWDGHWWPRATQRRTTTEYT